MRIIGHQRVRVQLKRLAARGGAVPTVLLVGPSHIGKSVVAREYITAAMGYALEDSRILSDVMVLSGDTEAQSTMPVLDLSVDAVRSAKAFLSRTPGFGAYRVVLIEHAQDLNHQAQNALLKVLEEPFEKALIVLVSTTEGALLPTIRSRVLSFVCHLVDEEEIREGITQMFPDQAAVVEPFFYSLGRPGVIVSALRNPEMFQEKRARLRKLFQVSKLTFAERAALSEDLAEHLAETQELLEWWLSGLHAQMRREGDPRRLQQYVTLLDRLMHDMHTLATVSVNTRLFLDQMLFAL